MEFVNYANAKLSLEVRRRVSMLGPSEHHALFHETPSSNVEWVAFESQNTITNQGAEPWLAESGWEHQNDPYAGDVVNSFNDGPIQPGLPSQGGFCELETSSPAGALARGASLRHTHRTLHFVGGRDALRPIARAALGVSLDVLPQN
jgi:hypothetical protein